MEAAGLSVGTLVSVSWGTFQGQAFASRLHPGLLLTEFRGFGRDCGDEYSAGGSASRK